MVVDNIIGLRTKSFEADDVVVTELQSDQGLTPFRSHMVDVTVCLPESCMPNKAPEKDRLTCDTGRNDDQRHVSLQRRKKRDDQSGLWEGKKFHGKAVSDKQMGKATLKTCSMRQKAKIQLILCQQDGKDLVHASLHPSWISVILYLQVALTKKLFFTF